MCSNTSATTTWMPATFLKLRLHCWADSVCHSSNVTTSERPWAGLSAKTRRYSGYDASRCVPLCDCYTHRRRYAAKRNHRRRSDSRRDDTSCRIFGGKPADTQGAFNWNSPSGYDRMWVTEYFLHHLTDCHAVDRAVPVSEREYCGQQLHVSGFNACAGRLRPNSGGPYLFGVGHVFLALHAERHAPRHPIQQPELR